MGGREGQTTVAVWETVEDLGLQSYSLLTFQMHFDVTTDAGLGKFRLLATTDDRSQFADGLATGGDVTANWTVLDVVNATAASGALMLVNPDGAIRVEDVNAASDLYTITAWTNLCGITGFRLEALSDSTLGGNGPGLAGNFALGEFAVTIAPIPEPGSLALAAFGALLWIGLAIAGCGGSDYPTVDLQGQVTVGGQAIDQGSLTFTPLAPGRGRGVTAAIAGGRYVARDVPAGKVRVDFQATQETGGTVMQFGKPYPEVANVIPDRYRAGLEIEVAGDDENQDFNL